MLFSERMKLEEEYYKWIEDNNAKFAIQDCPANVIAFLDSKGLFNVVEKDLPIRVKLPENLITIKYYSITSKLITICPFGKYPKVGSFACTECKNFISNDTIREIVVCEGKI